MVIGVDEAGYGPNLGPLVIGTTVWEVPGDPREFDWSSLSDGLIVAEATAASDRLQVADSKVVYSPGRGLAGLERGVWSGLALQSGPAAVPPLTLAEVVSHLSPETRLDDEPWYALPLSVPCHAEASSAALDGVVARLRSRCAERGVRLRAMGADVVLTGRYNRLVTQLDGKGRALTTLTLNLIGRYWNADDTEPALILCDKHGGRNRYLEFLQPLTDRLVGTLEESKEQSRYRVGSAEVRFQMQSERHLPVAWASMIAKYLRELSMKAFNAYWQAQIPTLRETAGYPVDAVRYWNDIAPARERLGIPRDRLWRER